MESVKHFVTSPCGLVHVYECDDGSWRVYIGSWHHSTHVNEVKAVIQLQRLTRVERK